MILRRLANVLVILNAQLLCGGIEAQTSADFTSARLLKIQNLNSEQEKAVDDYIRQNETLSGDLKIFADRNRIAVLSPEALRKLFPRYRFIAVPWVYEASPEAAHKYSIPVGLFRTLVLDEQGRNRMPYRGGAQEEYADLLHAEKIKITDEAFAALVAAAYTDIYGIGMSSKNLRRGSSDWLLGYTEWPFRAISSYEEIREATYYLISTDASGFVINGRSVNEVLERRKITSDQGP